MYIPTTFKDNDTSTINNLMRLYSFAQLVTNVNGVSIASHIPLLHEQMGKHGRLLGHVAKANKQWISFDGKTEALVIFNGPHGYISPSWYVSKNMVPTWNYISVHAYGNPKIISDPIDAIEVMRKLTAFYENNNNSNWSIDNLNDKFKEKKFKGIVTFEILINRVEGKFKLSQNRPLKDRLGAIKGLIDTGNFEAKRLAQFMKKILPNNN